MKLIKTIISNVSLISFISLISFVSLVSSCSKSDDFVDDGQNQNPAGVVIGGVSGYATSFEEKDNTKASGTYNPYKALTRAWELPDAIKSDYVDYESGAQPIAIAFTQNGVDPTKGSNLENPISMMRYFFKVDDEWRISKIEGIEAGNYQLYGYIPNNTGIKYSITDYDGGETEEQKNASYSTGAIMPLENVPSVMPQDFCVVIGAKHGYDKEHDGDNTNPRTNRLRQGDFAYTAASSPKGNFVFLLFDHLYAALRINMRVHDDYANVRKIKLKSLKLGTQVDDEKTKQKTDIKISLQANDGSASPIKEITYTQPDKYPAIEDSGLEFWSNSSGELLSTDFSEHDGHFMPSGITRFTLISTYDVYDLKDNLIREDCKAVNSVLVKDLLTEQITTERGNRYTVNMTIQPTYLYMLSEPDLDDPEVVIN